LLADICRHIFDYNDLSSGPGDELGFSLFEPAFTEGAAIRNHSTLLFPVIVPFLIFRNIYGDDMKRVCAVPRSTPGKDG
jgi:hypothetical protein